MSTKLFSIDIQCINPYSFFSEKIILVNLNNSIKMNIQKAGKNIFLFHLIPFLIFMILPAACNKQPETLDLSMYQYRDTKDLVRFVHDAALILRKEGMKSLGWFRSNRTLYNTKDHYLYIYDLMGTNIYHAGMEHLEGRNLWDIKDKNGKLITHLILEALENRNNPHAWVHYSWWEPGKFYPVLKSSCHFKVRTPEGKEILVGGGINYPHEEREFIRIIVDSAVDLIEKEGSEAIEKISDPASQFNYREVRVFAFRQDGEILISPVLSNSDFQIQILECVDEVGHNPFSKSLKELEIKDRVWEVFMARNRYQRDLVKKCLYVRKANLGDTDIYVAAITDLPQPPY